MKKSQDDLRVSWQDFRSHEKRVLDAIAPAVNKKAVLVIGDLGAGKSFTINRLMGVDYVEDNIGELVPDPAKPGQKIYCKTSSERVSSTVFPQVVKSEGSELAYIDTPGFKHVSAGDESPAAIATTVPILLNNVNVHGVLVLSEYQALTPQRGHLFAEFVTRLNKVIPVEKLKQRITFAFSKVVEPRQNVVKHNMNKYTDGIIPKEIVDQRCFAIAGYGNPNVDQIKASLDYFVTQPVIAKDQFSVNETAETAGGPFNNLSILIADKLAQFDSSGSQLIRDLYQALLNMTKAYQKIYACEMHIPDFKLLCGHEFKTALEAFLVHYENELFREESFPAEDFNKIMEFFAKLRENFDGHFKEATDQLAYFQSLLSSMQQFNQKRVAVKIPAITTLPAEHIGNKATASSLTQFRHLQQALVGHSSHKNYVGSQAKLLADYKPGTKCKIVNPLLFAQLTQALIAQEQSADLCHDKSLDPGNELLSHAKTVLKDNLQIMNDLAGDQNHFNSLVNDYYTQLTAVNTALSAYITSYQSSVTTALSTAFANGHSAVSINGLNLLGDPATFVNQFDGATINRLTGTFTSGKVFHRHGYAQDKVLNLDGNRIYHYLKGKISKELLAAEYLNLINFTDVRQTADVEHPVIPAERTGQDAKDCIKSLQPNIIHKGDNYIGFFGSIFFQAFKNPENWNINLALSARLTGGNAAEIFDLKLSGNYNGISVGTSLWLREKDGSKYSEPGGEGGYTHGLSSALAPFVRDKWQTGNNATFTCGAQKNITTPDINAWFTGHRNNIITALCDSGDPSRANLVTAYKNALSALDAAKAKLTSYSELIGKDKNDAVFTTLLDSAKITQAIRTNGADVTKSDLTPDLSAAIASNDKLTGAKVLGLSTVSGNTNKKYLTASANLLNAHEAWRVVGKRVPKLKMICPDSLVTINDYLVDLEPDCKSVIIQHRPLKAVLCARVARKISELGKLQTLTLKNVSADNKSLLNLLSGVKATRTLTELDISYNSCSDTQASAQELREVVGSLIANGKELTRLDVAHTKLGNQFVSYLSILLAKQPKLAKINLTGIEPCSNDVGLDLLASLFISNNVIECDINASSVDMLIADAIQFILKHKRDNAAAIPKDLQQRLDYFDVQLKSFLDSRAALLPDLDTRDTVFPSFSLKQRALKLVETVKGLTFEDVAKTTIPVAQAGVTTSPKKSATISQAYVKSVLNNSRFFKPLDAASREAKVQSHLQNYHWFHKELDTRFGLQRQKITGDGNCQFSAIAAQLLQLNPQQFPQDLAQHFAQRDQVAIAKQLRQISVDYIRRHREEFRPYFATGSLEYDGFDQFEDYLDHLLEDGVWGGDMTLHAISKVLNRAIYVVKPDFFERVGEPILPKAQHDFHLEDAIILLYNGINHYETIAQRPADNRFKDYYQEAFDAQNATATV